LKEEIVTAENLVLTANLIFVVLISKLTWLSYISIEEFVDWEMTETRKGMTLKSTLLV